MARISALAVIALLPALAAACTVYPAPGSNKVVLGLGGRGNNNWQDDGHGGVNYKPWNWNPHHIDSYNWAEGDSRVHINFQVPQTGEYVLLMETIAKHTTEFNDVYVRVWQGENDPKWMDKRCMCNPGHKTALGNHGFKVYQNTGGWSTDAYTVDHNPHAVTGYFDQGRTYTFEITGRSTQFKVKNVLFIKCNGAECNPHSGTVKGALSHGYGANGCH